MKTLFTRSLIAFALLAGTLSFTGCIAINDGVEPFLLRPKYTNELYTTTMTTEQNRESHRRVMDLNHRQLREDWIHFWLLDRPIRTSSDAPVR